MMLTGKSGRIVEGLLLGGMFVGLLQLDGSAKEEKVIVAVSSKVSEDYVRTKLPNGAFAPEAYAFGEGGDSSGAMKDASADNLRFKEVAHTIAPQLLTQNYIPAGDPAKAKLLIMVYWGVTNGAAVGASSSVAYQNLQASQQLSATATSAPVPGARADMGSVQTIDESALQVVRMANRQRDRANLENAGILGYTDTLAAAQGPESSFMRRRWTDLIEELEDDRYFVVLMAYDFQLLAKEKKHKLLWETRFSIREHGNAFDRQLGAMAQSASRFFGQDTHGLLRKPLPTERIRMEEMKILGEVPDK